MKIFPNTKSNLKIYQRLKTLRELKIFAKSGPTACDTKISKLFIFKFQLDARQSSLSFFIFAKKHSWPTS